MNLLPDWQPTPGAGASSSDKASEKEDAMTAYVWRQLLVLTVLAAGGSYAGAALAQNTMNQAMSGQTGSMQGETAIVPQETGVGPRGTKVAPSTNPAAPDPIRPSETGVLPRGNKVAESTPPPAST